MFFLITISLEIIHFYHHITIFFCFLYSGHLDRCVAGTAAMEILDSCYEDTSAPSAALREHQRKFKLNKHLTNMASHLPIHIPKTPQVYRISSLVFPKSFYWCSAALFDLTPTAFTTVCSTVDHVV